MINHPERITMSHIADIVSGKQKHISDFVELDGKEIAWSARRVVLALARHRKRKMGGEKI